MLIVAAGCGTGTENDEPRIANPAAVFCEEQGGSVAGEEPMCELPDGSVVDAWEYYRSQAGAGAGLANPAAVFCEDQGGTTSGPEPMCELPDGSMVDAWSYFRENGLED